MILISVHLHVKPYSRSNLHKGVMSAPFFLFFLFSFLNRSGHEGNEKNKFGGILMIQKFVRWLHYRLETYLVKHEELFQYNDVQFTQIASLESQLIAMHKRYEDLRVDADTYYHEWHEESARAERYSEIIEAYIAMTSADNELEGKVHEVE
jgi:hypothetical protein